MTKVGEEMVIGFAYEELSEDEMMDVDGGIAASLGTIVAASTLACGVGVGIGLIGVTVWYYATQ
jgi:hypothetical protein